MKCNSCLHEIRHYCEERSNHGMCIPVRCVFYFWADALLSFFGDLDLLRCLCLHLGDALAYALFEWTGDLLFFCEGGNSGGRTTGAIHMHSLFFTLP